MPPGLQPVPSPLHSDVTHERMLRHHRAHGRDARDRCTGAVSPSALQPRDPGWRGGRLLPPGLSEPFITPWAEIIELFSSVSVLLLDAPAVLAARTEAFQSFGRGCVFILLTRTSMDQIPPRHLNKTGVQMKKNLCVFAGFYVVQEIVSSCSDVIMRNRLLIFEGFPLPAAEEMIYFLRQRMVPFSALCRRDFFFFLEDILNYDHKIS